MVKDAGFELNVAESVLQLSLVRVSLQHEAETTGTTTWKATPKVQLLRHLGVEQARRSDNPRFTWTFADEDAVGAMMEVSRACHSCTFTETALSKHLVRLFCDDI